MQASSENYLQLLTAVAAVVSAATALVASFAGPLLGYFLTVRHERKKARATSRSEWLRLLRTNFSEMMAAGAWFAQGNRTKLGHSDVKP